MPTVPIFNSSLSLVKGSPLNVQADCIVNAAIPTLKPTPGICNAIYKAADTAKLKEACSAIGDCKPGKIAVTDSCGLPFFCILHAVAPVMIDGKYKENKLLTDCYRQCIEFAADKNLHSIVFPLLGSAKVSGSVRTSSVTPT